MTCSVRGLGTFTKVSSGHIANRSNVRLAARQFVGSCSPRYRGDALITASPEMMVVSMPAATHSCMRILLLASTAVGLSEPSIAHLLACASTANSVAADLADTAHAQVETRRWPIGKLFPGKAGQYAQLEYRQSLNASDSWIASLIRQLGNAAVAAQLRASIDGLNGDALAVYFLRNGYDLQAFLVLKKIGQRMNEGLPKDKQRDLSEEPADVAQLDGSLVQMPGTQAHAYMMLGSIYAARALHSRLPLPRLAGKYEMEARGACPVTSGPIELRQDEAVVEGIRGEVPEMIGVIGESRAYFEFPEQAYAITRVDKSQPNEALELTFPETRSRFFVAKLSRAQLALIASDGSSCSATLTRSAG